MVRWPCSLTNDRCRDCTSTQFGRGLCGRTSRCHRPRPTHHGDYHVKLGEFNCQFGQSCALTRGFGRICVSLLRRKTFSTRQTTKRQAASGRARGRRGSMARCAPMPNSCLRRPRARWVRDTPRRVRRTVETRPTPRRRNPPRAHFDLREGGPAASW